MVELKDLKYTFNIKQLSYVVNCLVIEVDNTIQVVKNRGGDLTFEAVNNFDFIKITINDMEFCDNDYANFYGKNIWFIGTEKKEAQYDYDIKIQNIKQKVDGLNRILKDLENKRDNKWFEEISNQIGIDAAIYQWCKTNDKYYSKVLLDASICESAYINNQKKLKINSLRCYKKYLSLIQYNDKKFKETFEN